MQSIPLLLLVFAGLSLMTSATLAWVWALSGRPAFLAAWAGACLAIGVARLIFASTALLPTMLLLGVGNALLIAATTLLWAGARHLRGHPPAAWLVMAPALLWLGLGLWPGFYASAPLRVAVASSIIAGISAAFALEMLRLHRTGLARMLSVMIAALALLYGLSYLARPFLPSVTGGIAINLPMVVVGGTLFLAIGLLALVMGQLDATERDARLQDAARLREASLLAETARREAEALRLGRQEIQRLHRALPAMIFHGYLKPDGKVGRIYRNGNWEAVFGWPQAELDGLETFEALSDYGGTTLPELYAGVLREGSGCWEWRMRRQDGGWSWLRTEARRVENAVRPGGEVVAYVFNIDREREAEARALVVARLAALGDMAAGLAQELKAPLGSISRSAEAAQALGREAGNAALDDRLGHIVFQAHRAIEIVEHLHRFARGETEEGPAQEIRLDQAVRDALALAGDALRSAGIEVETSLAEPPPRIQGQLVALEQVLTNLIMNARDAMAERPPGAARRLRISVSSGATGQARLTIADTGGGIAPSVMGRLFEPFVTTKGAATGTGLGLSICHGLVRAMHGSMDASNSAEGAVFTITLPAVAT